MRSGTWPLLLALIVLAAASRPASAQDAASAAGCSAAEALPKQILCFLEAAEAGNDVTICDGAYDFAVRFNCIAKFAENRGDPGPCERIPGRTNRLLVMRDACVSGVAAAARAPLLCGRVQLAFLRDTCFMTQVVEYGAPAELCERIARSEVRQMCLADR